MLGERPCFYTASGLRAKGIYTLPATYPPVQEPSEPPAAKQSPAALDEYDVALATLENYFATASNVVVARHRFGQRAQLPGESIDAFVTELRDLSSNCELGSMADEFIQDQLVAKTASQHLRECLLLERSGLTLDRALVIGRLVEEAVRYSKELVSSSAVQKVDAKSTTNGG